jgi:hypothetical protein
LATVHCLTGCGIGEVAGMAIGSAAGWSNHATIVLAIALAFAAGYALAMIPLRRGGPSFGAALKVAAAAESISIAIMEVVDNAVVLAVPGAMDAPLSSGLFWGSLLVSLLIAAVAAFPANRWLIARGRGHALGHAHHGGR